MNTCIFEDEQAINLHPLSLSRPVFDLRCGICTLAEKITRLLPKSQSYYHTRSYMLPYIRSTKRAVVKKQTLQNCLFINGCVVAKKQLFIKILSDKKHDFFYSGSTLIAAKINQTNKKFIRLGPGGLSVVELPPRRGKVLAHVIKYPWDLVHHNPEEISADAQSLYQLGIIKGKIYPSATIVGKKNVYIAPGAVIAPGVVIDAETGPVIIEKKSEVMAQATLTGPLYIGQGSKIKVGAKIYGGTTIGDVCKIGGEVEESIVHGYSNKQHEGFLGHAYIGSWCNLGADTNNSDLKNNYGTVDVILNGEKIDTGQTFVGLFMGDHSKSGINTMFNTGTVVGFSSNVFGAGYLPKSIPSFSWFDAQHTNQPYRLDKALEVAKLVMARRKVKFSSVDKKIFQYLYQLTKKEHATHA